VYTYLFRFVRRSGKVDCAERTLGGTVIGSKQIRLVSSEENEIYVTSHVTDTFEIGFLDEKSLLRKTVLNVPNFMRKEAQGHMYQFPKISEPVRWIGRSGLGR